jgi:hypothetical protein
MRMLSSSVLMAVGFVIATGTGLNASANPSSYAVSASSLSAVAPSRGLTPRHAEDRRDAGMPDSAARKSFVAFRRSNRSRIVFSLLCDAKKAI